MPLFYQKTVTYVYSLPVTYLTTLYTLLVRLPLRSLQLAGQATASCHSLPSERLCCKMVRPVTLFQCAAAGYAGRRGWRPRQPDRIETGEVRGVGDAAPYAL